MTGRLSTVSCIRVSPWLFLTALSVAIARVFALFYKPDPIPYLNANFVVGLYLMQRGNSGRESGRRATIGALAGRRR